MRNRPFPFAVALTVAVLFNSSLAFACSVPVFRYALEQWPPDSYQLYLFHRGELSEEQGALARQIASRSPGGKEPVNIELTRVDLDADPEPELVKVWEAQENETLPLLAVRMPQKGDSADVWAGEFTQESIDRILDSPLRKEIGERILGGHSAVWIFLESGVQEQDEKAYELITAELARLEQEIKRPAEEGEDEVTIRFSAVRLSRDDPEEQFLVEMLLRVEPDLLDQEFASLPMAFPAFGRGRVLYALVGAGISSNLIEDACLFLTGDCQCTVKAQNPGMDLVMAVDWDHLVEPTLEEDTPAPPLAGLTGFAGNGAEAESGELSLAKTTEGPAAPVASRSDSAAAPEPPFPAATGAGAGAGGGGGETATEPSIGRNALLVALGLILAVVIGSVFLAPRQH